MRLRYLISLITKDNDYQREQGAAAEDAARKLGVDTEILFANSDAITQSQQLLDILQSSRVSEFNGVVMEPAGGTSMTQVARIAIKAKVAWVVLNRQIDEIEQLRASSEVPVFSVSSDHDEIGRIQGQQFGALLPHGGTVMYIQGPSTSQVAQRRSIGMYETKPANVVVKVLKCPAWTDTDAYQSVSSWLRLSVAQKERIDVVAGQNDLIAMGARKAVREKIAGDQAEKWEKVLYTGVDGLPKTGQAWVSSGVLAATVVTPPNTVTALNLLVQAARDRTRPPERTLVQPISFPEIDQLRRAHASDGRTDRVSVKKS
ncbi:MAG: hypothetical protein NVS9B4_09450 [Candidatus Acidiferrum sp.]